LFFNPSNGITTLIMHEAYVELYFYAIVYLSIYLKKKLVKCYIWNISFVLCWNLDASGNKSETRGKFWNVVLEGGGEDQLDQSYDKWGSVT
jgi:hypothetical protein